MDIEQMRILVSAANTLNFTQTAKQMHVSRQAVTYTTHKAEVQLGAKLFSQANNNRLVLTQKGKLFARKANEIVNAYDKLVNLMRASEVDNLEAITILSSTGLLTYELPQLLNLFFQGEYASYVHVNELPCAKCVNKIVRKEADLALVHCMPRNFSGCKSIALGKIPFELVVGEDNHLAELSSISIDDLWNQSFILLSGFEYQYQSLAQKCNEAGFALKRSHVVNTLEMAFKLVEMNAGVMIVGSEGYLNAPEHVSVIPFADEHMYWSVYLLYRDDSDKRELTLRIKDDILDALNQSQISNPPWP